MQTFMPYRNFEETASVLDSKRLNKQILEGYQIMNSLSKPNERVMTGSTLRYPAWRRHPAVLMWESYEHILYDYVTAMIVEGHKRNIEMSQHERNLDKAAQPFDKQMNQYNKPWWFDEPFISKVERSHRFNLHRKDSEAYSRFMHEKIERCCLGCNYWWPTHYVPPWYRAKQ